MGFAPLYLLNRFFFRLTDFFYHWYASGSRWFGHRYIGTLEHLDRSLALRITVRMFFRPLYGDYSIIGRILGIIFRMFRIAFAIILYAICSALFAICYLLWLLIPFLPLYMAYRNLLTF